ncbi:hypothetical protein BDV96DRAFT_342932 [Lophiotrema nucula]|uniref:Uncharacterized protein n=1 Tax=Lophiotrema nucula TaxID=690887 RepID=A0A6A5ZJ79_9PLEO|nr:hypothetical protein BDV96DRAFT_342932 [Lophiotrema nucula]
MDFVPHRCAWRRADTCQCQTLLRVHSQPLLNECSGGEALMWCAGVEKGRFLDTCVEADQEGTSRQMLKASTLQPATSCRRLNTTRESISLGFSMLTVSGRSPRSRYPSPSRRRLRKPEPPRPYAYSRITPELSLHSCSTVLTANDKRTSKHGIQDFGL